MYNNKELTKDEDNAQETFNDLQAIRDQSIEEQDNESENEENSEDARWTDISRQPKGWWSSGNIIATLSEQKIRQAIESYRQIISLLENELVSRRMSPTRHYNEITGLSLHETRSPSRRGMQYVGANKQRTVGVLTKLRPRLRSVRQKKGQAIASMLEDTWCKILEIYYEEHK